MVGDEFSSENDESLQIDKDINATGKYLKLKIGVIIAVLLTSITFTGITLYYTTIKDIERYTKEQNSEQLYKILVDSSSYHFWGDRREIELLALHSIHQVDIDKFKKAGWEILQEKVDNDLSYKDVLDYSDIDDMKYFAHLYVGVPGSITADGFDRYAPFSSIVNELLKRAPNSKEMKEIADVYRSVNIKDAEKKIKSLLSSMSDINSYGKHKDELKKYGLPFDNSIVIKYEDQLAEIDKQKDVLSSLKSEKYQVKDPGEYEKQILELRSNLGAKANHYSHLSGFVVAQLSYNEYEIIVKDGGCFIDSGEIGRHAILITCDSRYESKGFFYDMPIWSSLDTREVLTRDGFWQEWYLYHEKSRQEVAEIEHYTQVWNADLEKAISEKAQVENKIKDMDSQIDTQEKRITSLENQNQQIMESWNKQYKAFADTVNNDLNKLATTYVDEKVLPGKLKLKS